MFVQMADIGKSAFLGNRFNRSVAAGESLRSGLEPVAKDKTGKLNAHQGAESSGKSVPSHAAS